MNKFLNSFYLRATTLLLLCGMLLGGCQPAAAPTPVPAAVTDTLVETPVATPTAVNDDRIRILKYLDNFTAFKIKSPGGATIITDPFMMDEEASADIVTESHQHGDHTDVSRIVEPYKLLTGPGVFELADVKVTGIAGMHNKPGVNFNNYAMAFTNNIFVFDLGSIRLAQFASQGQMPTPAMFAQIGKVDILIIQIFNNHNTKLTMLEAQEIAAEVSARIIIPAHGDLLAEEFAKYIDADFKREPSGILEISRGELDQITTPLVIWLDR